MNLRYIYSATVVFAFRSVRVNFPYVISNLAFPLSLLFIVGVLSEGTLLPFALAGGLVAIMAINGISASNYLATFRQDYKYQDLIITTKTSAITYMIAELVSNLIWCVPSVALYIVMDLYFGLLSPFSFLVTMVVALLTSLATVSLGFIIAGLVKHTRQMWALATILSTLVTVVAPTFYPYTYLSRNVLLVLSIIPTTPGAVLEQGVFGLAPIHWYMLLILVIETAVLFVLAKYFTPWRER